MKGYSNLFTSNSFGDFVIIDDSIKRSTVIKFLDTGGVREVQRFRIKTGEIRDYMAITICGVACIGGSKYGTSLKFKSIYARYKHMLSRCYSEKSQWYHIYGSVGVRDCDEWLNYQNYAEWFISESKKIGEDPFNTKFQVDKDISGMMIYSPEGCVLISPQRNTEVALAKNYELQDIHGVVHKIFNMSKFARDNGLNASPLIKVLNGKLETSQGYCRVGYKGKFRGNKI